MRSTVEELGLRLRKNPSDINAFSELRAYYQETEDHASLANLLEGWAGRWDEDEAAAAAFYEAGELCLGPLRDVGRAVDMFQRALARHPLHLDASLRLQGIYESHQDYRRLAELLQARLKSLASTYTEPSDLAIVHHQLGELWQHNIGDEEEALRHYTRAFQTHPYAVASIYAARAIYYDRGALDNVAELYRLECDAEPNTDRRVALFREFTYLLIHGLANVDLAIETLQEAIRQHPEATDLLLDLSDALLVRATQNPGRASEDLYQAADCYVAAADLASSPEDVMGFLVSALDACPGHDESLRRLEALGTDAEVLVNRWLAYLDAAPEGPLGRELRLRLGEFYLDRSRVLEAADALEPLVEKEDMLAADLLVDCYQRLGRTEDLLNALTIAAQQPDRSGVVRAHELIELLEERGSHQRAIDTARDLLSRFPADPIAVALIEEDCRVREDHRGLRDVLFNIATRGQLSQEERKARLVEVARISLDHLDESAAALSAWQHVVNVDPGDVAAREAIEELLEQASKWDELAQTIEHEAEQHADRNQKATLFSRLGRVHRSQRGDPKAAIEAYYRAREFAPNDPEIREQLCTLLLESGREPEAIPLLRHRIAGTSKDDQLGLLRKLTELLEQLQDLDGAYESCTEILTLSAKDENALDTMERIDRATKRWDRLVETLSYRSELLEGKERARVIAEIGAVCEDELHEFERASDYYWRALDINPEDLDCLDRLTRNYERRGMYRKLVELLKERAEAHAGTRIASELFRRIARTLGGHVGNLEAAREAWEKILATQEDEEALRFLVGYTDAQTDPVIHLGYLGRLSAVTGSKTESRALRTEQARLLRDHDPPRALQVIETVLREEGPRDVQLLSLASDIAAANDMPKAQAQALRQLLELVTEGNGSPKEMVDWTESQVLSSSQQLAALYDGTVRDNEGERFALAVWSKLAPKDPLPRKRILPLLEDLGDHKELVEHLVALIDLTPREQEREVLLLRASETLRTQLNQPQKAFDLLKRHVANGHHGLEEPLRELAREHDLAEPLSWVHVNAAKAAAEPAAQRRHWWQAALILKDDLKDHGKALEAALRGLAADLENEELLALVEELVAETRAWDRLEAVYERLWEHASDDAAKGELGIRFGMRVHDEAPDRAVGWLVRAGILCPQDERPFLQAESAAAGDQELIRKVMRGYRERVEKTDSLRTAVDSLLRCAVLAMEELQDEVGACQFLVEAAEATENQPELLERVDQHTYRFAGPDFARTAPLESMAMYYHREAQLKRPNHAADAAQLLGRAARLRDQQGDEAAAFELFEEAASMGFESSDRMRDFVNFGRKAGRLDDVHAVLTQLVDDCVDRTDAVSLLALEAMLLDQDLDRPGDAVDAYKRILTLRPGHEEASKRTIELLQQLEQHEDLLVVLEQQIRACEGTQRIELLRAMADTWEHHLKNRWEAIDAWSRVLSEDPNDKAAAEAIQRLSRASKPAAEPDEEAPAPGSDATEDRSGAPLQGEDTHCTDPGDPVFNPSDRLPKCSLPEPPPKS